MRELAREEKDATRSLVSIQDIVARFKPMTAGEVLDRSFELCRANFALIFGISLTNTAPLCASILYYLYFVINYRGDWRFGGYVATIVMLTLCIAFLLLFRFVSLGAGVSALMERLMGRETTILRSYWRGIRRSLPLLFCGSLTWLLGGFGFLFYFVPGVLPFAFWSLAPTAIMLEDRQYFDALKSSSEMSRLVSGKVIVLISCCVFFWFLGSANILWCKVGALELAHSVFDVDVDFIRKLPLQNLFILSVAWIIVEPLKIAGLTLLYVDARVRREGVDLSLKIDSLIDSRSSE